MGFFTTFIAVMPVLIETIPTVITYRNLCIKFAHLSISCKYLKRI